MEETLFLILNIHQNLSVLFPSLCVYLFENCPSQFLIHWESCSESKTAGFSLVKPKHLNTPNMVL